MAQNQADYNKEHEMLTTWYEKTKSRIDEVEAEIHDKNSRRKSIEHYLAILEERGEAIIMDMTPSFGAAWWNSRPSTARTTYASP